MPFEGLGIGQGRDIDYGGEKHPTWRSLWCWKVIKCCVQNHISKSTVNHKRKNIYAYICTSPKSRLVVDGRQMKYGVLWKEVSTGVETLFAET